MSIQTNFTKLFNCRVPIMGAPMAGVSGGILSAATSRGGALGFLAGGYLEDEEKLRKEVNVFRKEAPPGAPLCIGFITCHATRDGPDRVVRVMKEHSPFAVQLFAPAIDLATISAAKDMGIKVVAQVGCERDAIEAIDAGIDCVIAQGREAGGHGLRSEVGSSTLPLAARVAGLAKKRRDGGNGKLGGGGSPVVLAAGGIVDGRGVAAAIALGCDGAVFGTRLWASKEAMGPTGLKGRLVEAGPDQVLRSRVFDKIMNTYSGYEWEYPYDSVGVVANELTDEWEGRLDKLEDAIKSSTIDVAQAHKTAVTKGDPKVARVYAGEGVGDIDSIDSAQEIIERAERETVSVISSMQNLLVS